MENHHKKQEIVCPTEGSNMSDPLVNPCNHFKPSFDSSDDLMADGSASTGTAKPVDEHIFLKRMYELLMKEAVKKGVDYDTPVLKFHYPEELMEKFDFTIREQGESDDRLLELSRQVIDWSVRTGHPRFFNQLFAGYDVYGLAGSWLTEAVNTSQYTYEMAPVFSLMEQYVLEKMRTYIGFSVGDGIFCPGGSISNMYGINIARHHAFPEIKKKGVFAAGAPICIFASNKAHYSIEKSAAFLGLGSEYCIKVQSDSRGKMIPEELEAAIVKAKAEGIKPFCVIATCGTTVFGAYDSIPEIHDICARHKLWLHVDTAWGGGVLLSRKYRHLLTGIENADSVTWNPHKMMGTTQQCSAFLTRHENLLSAAHSSNAKYLFQKDKFYDVSFDTGDKSVQCGRHVDVFKLWLMWKSKGDVGFEERIDKAFDNAKYLYALIQSRPDSFRIALPDPECTNVCFWYIPPSMRGQNEDADWWERIATVAPKIKERMMKTGSSLITYTSNGDLVNFFRMVVMSDRVSHDDMKFVICEIEKLGCDL